MTGDGQKPDPFLLQGENPDPFPWLSDKPLILDPKGFLKRFGLLDMILLSFHHHLAVTNP